MEFEFESKEIKELIKDVEDARKKYYRALSKLGVKISDDKNDLIICNCVINSRTDILLIQHILSPPL